MNQVPSSSSSRNGSTGTPAHTSATQPPRPPRKPTSAHQAGSNGKAWLSPLTQTMKCTCGGTSGKNCTRSMPDAPTKQRNHNQQRDTDFEAARISILPDRATGSPRLTWLPMLARAREQCVYCVRTPRPWSIVTATFQEIQPQIQCHTSNNAQRDRSTHTGEATAQEVLVQSHNDARSSRNQHRRWETEAILSTLQQKVAYQSG